MEVFYLIYYKHILISGFFQTLKQVRLEEGYAGWYSGLRVHLFRVIPNNAIMMSVVEYITHKYAKG